MKSHANVTVHSFTAKKLMSLMSLTNQKSMNFTTQKSMSLTTQKSMNRRAHKTCLNCLGAIYINLLEVFCFLGGFCAFFHKKLICMFFWEMHLHVTLAENESDATWSQDVKMQPLLEVSKQQIHWSTNFGKRQLPLSTRESCTKAIISSVQICYGVIVTVDIDLERKCKDFCALVSCKGLPINSPSPKKTYYPGKRPQTMCGEWKDTVMY